MSPEKTKQLIENYPKIFSNITDPAPGNMQLPITIFMFECGDGWFNLIDNLCTSIQNHIDYNHAPQVVVDQVKEKFGSLRFYYSGGDDIIRGMVWFAENVSGKTCEVCGAPGKTRGKGWYYTSCDAHAKPGDLDDSL